MGKHTTDGTDWRWLVSFLFWTVLICYVAYYSVTFLFFPREYYATKYAVGIAKVTIMDKPHDCEFDAVPYGKKYCHYEKLVETEKDATGKVTEVYITWQKVQE